MNYAVTECVIIHRDLERLFKRVFEPYFGTPYGYEIVFLSAANLLRYRTINRTESHYQLSAGFSQSAKYVT